MIPIDDMTDPTLAIKDTDEDLVIKVKIVKRSDTGWSEETVTFNLSLMDLIFGEIDLTQ